MEPKSLGARETPEGKRFPQTNSMSVSEWLNCWLMPSLTAIWLNAFIERLESLRRLYIH